MELSSSPGAATSGAGLSVSRRGLACREALVHDQTAIHDHPIARRYFERSITPPFSVCHFWQKAFDSRCGFGCGLPPQVFD